MNLDEIKATWKMYDQKLTATKRINEKLVRSMIRERSGSALSKMRMYCLLTIIFMAFLIWFCIMSIIYNAFDFEFSFQFLPLYMYIVIAGIFIFYLVKEYLHSKVDLYSNNLKDSLATFLALHKKFVDINMKLGLAFLFSAILYLLSASIKVALNEGVLYSVLFFLGGVLVSGTVFFIAFKLGAFEDHLGNKLKAQLEELDEFEQVDL